MSRVEEPERRERENTHMHARKREGGRVHRKIRMVELLKKKKKTEVKINSNSYRRAVYFLNMVYQDLILGGIFEYLKHFVTTKL